MPAPGRAEFASANLTPASRRQAPTILPSAKASFVSASLIAHGSKPALRSRCAPNAAASTASRPASVTIAIRPCVGQDGEGYRFDLGQAETGIFLQTGLDGGNQTEPFQTV